MSVRPASPVSASPPVGGLPAEEQAESQLKKTAVKVGVMALFLLPILATGLIAFFLSASKAKAAISMFAAGVAMGATVYIPMLIKQMKMQPG